MLLLSLLIAATGWGYPTIADPPVVNRDEVACSTVLFDVSFKNYSAHAFSVPPLTCPGGSIAGRRLVLSLGCNVTAGRQFDRSVFVWLQGALVLAGTTSEPRKAMAPQWVVEAEVTHFAALLGARELEGAVQLGTQYSPVYDGLPSCTATLAAYSVVDVAVPNVVLPFGGAAKLPYATELVARMPRGVVAAYVEVTAQGQGMDEFWWSCLPSNISSALGPCPNSALRVVELWVDGVLVTVGSAMPYVFTGGDDPQLWIPIPNAQTLLMQPQRFDIEAGFLSSSAVHNVTVRVGPATNNGWFVEATLFLVMSSEEATESGILSHSGPSEIDGSVSVSVNMTTLSGQVRVQCDAAFETISYVIVPGRGNVTTRRTRLFHFANWQDIVTMGNISQSVGVQLNSALVVRTSEDGSALLSSKTDSVRMESKVALVNNNASVATQDSFFVTVFGYEEFQPSGYKRQSDNIVVAQDRLFINVTGGGFSILGNTNQWSKQTFYFSDTANNYYSGIVNAVANVVTSTKFYNALNKTINAYK